MMGGRYKYPQFVSNPDTRRVNLQTFEVAMTSTELAAWVQAIGGLLAIVGAFLISSRQFNQATRLQESAQKSDMHRRYQALIGLIEAAIDDFGDILTALQGTNPVAWFDENSSSEIMAEYYAALKQVSPLDMPSSSAARSIVMFRDRLKTAGWNANQAIETASGGTMDDGFYRQCVEAFEHNLQEVKSENRKLQEELAKQ
jgi:hypothetical protein